MPLIFYLQNLARVYVSVICPNYFAFAYLAAEYSLCFAAASLFLLYLNNIFNRWLWFVASLKFCSVHD